MLIYIFNWFNKLFKCHQHIPAKVNIELENNVTLENFIPSLEEIIRKKDTPNTNDSIELRICWNIQFSPNKIYMDV